MHILGCLHCKTGACSARLHRFGRGVHGFLQALSVHPPRVKFPCSAVQIDSWQGLSGEWLAACGLQGLVAQAASGYLKERLRVVGRGLGNAAGHTRHHGSRGNGCDDVDACGPLRGGAPSQRGARQPQSLRALPGPRQSRRCEDMLGQQAYSWTPSSSVHRCHGFMVVMGTLICGFAPGGGALAVGAAAF